MKKKAFPSVAGDVMFVQKKTTAAVAETEAGVATNVLSENCDKNCEACLKNKICEADLRNKNIEVGLKNKNFANFKKCKKIGKKIGKKCKKNAKKPQKIEKNEFFNNFLDFFGLKKIGIKNNGEIDESTDIFLKEHAVQKNAGKKFDKKLSKNFEKNQKNTQNDENNFSDVLLVGNPNTGKTTLFNSLTCSDEHVGNWHGVTVENKQKPFVFDGQNFLLVDTPGLYSLCPLSFEEEVAANTIFEHSGCKIINLCDQNNLKRNLYLTLCLLESGANVVVAVNEIDKKPIYKVDCKKLSAGLGAEVVAIDAERKSTLVALKKTLCENQNLKAKTSRLAYIENLPFDREILKKWLFEAKNSKKTQKKVHFLNFSENFWILKAYEKDKKFFENLGLDGQILFDAVPKNSVQILAKARYDFIEKLLSSCAQRTDKVYGKSPLDKIFLNKFLAFPIFLCVLAAIFYLTFFSLGGFLSDLFSGALSAVCNPITNFLRVHFGEGFVTDLFENAIFGGIGTVLAFLPQVVLLFFFLSVLEDSGYLSRVAFIFEDILGRIGLSGKSVYTLLMGFGCSTTAIMTARNMDDRNAKIKTAMLCPYMSCSAKIPIYTILGGAFFGAKNIFVIFGLYFLGVLVALCLSKILDKSVLKSKKQSFILEFPPYRASSPKRLAKIVWKNVKEFLLRVGSIMICVNIIVFLLSNFSFSFAYVPKSGGTSMLQQFGKILAPIFAPLGFGNWAVVSALLAGLVAKEVVVSSIAMFNGVDTSATKLLAQSVLLPTSVVFFASKASVISFLVFCLLYTPCLASIAMLRAEIGGKWTIISVCLQLAVGWLSAFVIYNICLAVEVFGAWAVAKVALGALVPLLAVWVLARKIARKKLCQHCNSCTRNCKRK